MTSRMKILFNITRGRHFTPKSWKPEAVQCGLVKYYPRQPGEVDAPFTPSKILMVHRVKPFKGNPYWQKDILTAIGLQEQGMEPVIVKNTPEMCAKLWAVKHLIKVTPVNLPKDISDVKNASGTYLHENGNLYFSKVDARRYEATEKFMNDVKRMDKALISERLRLRWLSGTLE